MSFDTNQGRIANLKKGITLVSDISQPDESNLGVARMRRKKSRKRKQRESERNKKKLKPRKGVLTEREEQI